MLRKLVVVLLLSFGLFGCANQVDRSAMLNAIAEAAAKCNGEPGCIATLNAAIYSGGLLQDENSTPRIITSFIPVLDFSLRLTQMIMGYSGNGNMGGGFVLNRSSGNTFILNKQSADRSSRVDAPFSMTTSNTENYSWQDMYNPNNSSNWK